MSQQAIGAGDGGEFLRVAMRMFSERERWHLTRVLMQAAQRSGRRVVDAAPREADVIFVNPDESGAKSFLKAGQARKRPLTVTYGSSQAVADALHLPKPAETRLVLPLLEKLEQQLSSEPGQPAQAESAVLPAPVPTHDFVSAVIWFARAAGERKSVRIQLDEETSFYLQPGRGKVWLAPSVRNLGWETLCQRMANLDDGHFDFADPVELPEILKQGGHQEGSLQELVWTLSFLSEPEHSPNSSILDKPVRVARCPNFTRIPHDRIHVTWAVRMMRVPMTLADLLDQSAEDPLNALRFYNACLLSGLLRPAGRGEMRSSGNANAGQSSVISRIRSRLGNR